MKNVSRSTPISLPSFPSFFPFFFFLSPFHWPISPQEFSSIILDFCSPLCYAGYVGNVARNLEMVRGLQSPIFRGGMELHWVLGSFSPPLLPNLSLSSSPPFLSLPTVFFFYISHHFYFSARTFLPCFSSAFLFLHVYFSSPSSLYSTFHPPNLWPISPDLIWLILTPFTDKWSWIK